MDIHKEHMHGKKGISNLTLAVLVMLALVMTIIGAWAVFTSMHNTPEPQASGSNVGHVSFVVVPRQSSGDGMSVDQKG